MGFSEGPAVHRENTMGPSIKGGLLLVITTAWLLGTTVLARVSSPAEETSRMRRDAGGKEVLSAHGDSQLDETDLMLDADDVLIREARQQRKHKRKMPQRKDLSKNGKR